MISNPQFRYEMDTSVSPAVRAAALKRERAAAAKLARVAGKAAAAEKRAAVEACCG